MKKHKYILIAIAIGIVVSAIMVFLLKRKKSYKNRTYDATTERNLATLHPEVADKFRIIIGKLIDKGHDVRLISGNRTCSEQDSLYAKGRTTSGNIVTNAPCGKSYHNYALAGDLAFYVDGKYWNDAPWQEYGNLCKELGGEWGGDWESLYDPPHCQFNEGYTINELYAMYQETGKLRIV